MKRILIAAAILTSLVGCATDKKWETYAAANNCEYSGDHQMRRSEFMSMNQSTSNGAMNLNPAPQLEFRPVYKYNCKNGSMWTYSPPS